MLGAESARGTRKPAGHFGGHRRPDFPSATGGTLTWEIAAGDPSGLCGVREPNTALSSGKRVPRRSRTRARARPPRQPEAYEAFLEQEFGAWIEAVADCPPRAVFVDSFELVGELPWTTAFGSKFNELLGYDVEPMLPFLFLEGGESEYLAFLQRRGERPLPSVRRAGRPSARRLRGHPRRRYSAEELIGTLHSWLRGPRHPATPTGARGIRRRASNVWHGRRP